MTIRLVEKPIRRPVVSVVLPPWFVLVFWVLITLRKCRRGVDELTDADVLAAAVGSVGL